MDNLSRLQNFPVHGGDIAGFAQKAGLPVEAVIDFSSNINPLGLPLSAKRAYDEAVSQLTVYPDPRTEELRQIIAQEHHLDSDQVIAGNGSIALIALAIRSWKPKRALLVEPCFNEYRRLLHLNDVIVTSMHLQEEDDFRFPFAAIMQQLKEVDLVVLGHPNNPTGTALSPEDMQRLMDAADRRGICVILDEAFVDWCSSYSMIPYLSPRGSTVIIRSLTKFYALAGIRIGYACASRDMIARMRRYQETWSCNGVAQQLGVAALSDREFREATLAWFQQESAFMREELSRIPSIKVFFGLANFFLCKVRDPDQLKPFWMAMQKSGLYLRAGDDFARLGSGFFRVALRAREDNRILLQKWKEIGSTVTVDAGQGRAFWP
jgi:threonine-phosphate decarboxylase